MLLNTGEVNRYLARIGITERPLPTLESLNIIQQAHMCSAPYENMDILNKKRLSMEPAALYEKVVLNHRGGYCFELNGAYGLLLRSLGYNVVDLFGRFLMNETGIPMRRHRVLVVTIEKRRFLCDVGVGMPMPRVPVELTSGIEQPQQYGSYMLTRDDTLGWVLNERHEGLWRPLYCFTEEPQLPVDFVAVTYFCENAPESIFNKDVMLAIRTPDGRITMDGLTLKFFKGEREFFSQRELGDAVERLAAMKRYFGLENI